MARPYRILLAEDHVIFREMIKKSLQEIPDLEVVGEVSDGLELLEYLKAKQPQMIILDIGLPRLSGMDAAQRIKKEYPKIKILLLTMYKSKDHFSRAMEVGVDGYLVKEDAFNDLLTAINSIREGKPYISMLLYQQLLTTFSQEPRRPFESEPLSPRETEVLKFYGDGKSSKEIAELLAISPSTLRIHLSNIKRKLFIKTNADLVRYAIKKGYSSLT